MRHLQMVREEKAHGLGDVLVELGSGGPGGTCICVPAEALEVIRQPFKRGEVVYAPRNPNEDYVLVKDEWDGKVLLAYERTGMYETDASLFERRP